MGRIVGFASKMRRMVDLDTPTGDPVAWVTAFQFCGPSSMPAYSKFISEMSLYDVVLSPHHKGFSVQFC